MEKFTFGIGIGGDATALSTPRPDVPTTDRIGQIVAGRYRLDEEIGAGGMGRVYKAQHLALGEAVAVKFLLAVWAAQPSFRARFQREAVALARLRHPSIVSILDVGEERGEPYMVMELVRGESLTKPVLKGEKPMDLARIGRVFDHILQVLEVAHAAGIVHRDLKLDNVMLVPPQSGDEDIVKVLDFGLAHVEVDGGQRLTETGAVQGTPHYMSPEQCRGDTVGPPTDVYAVAVMLYEAISTSLPFSANDAAQLMAQHLFVEPPPVATKGVKRAVSAGLDALLMRALAKAPEDRPTAAEMRKELGEALLGTDARSLAEAGAIDRARVGALSREERALGGSGQKAQDDATLGDARAVFWNVAADRAAPIVTALGIAGLRAVVDDGTDVPAQLLGERGASGPRVLVLTDDDGAVARMARARVEGGRAIPTIVIGVAGSERTVALVRANVSDVALASLAAPEIARKIKRLVKKRPGPA